MARGEKSERLVLEYVQKNYDKNARLIGGMDNTANDIESSIGIIEVKGVPAQCGQFTLSTADKYAFSNLIVEKFKEIGLKNNATIEEDDICKDWVRNYYLNVKKVDYFGIHDRISGKIFLLTPDEFFNNCTFGCTYRCKKSGTSHAAKWVEKYVPEYWQCQRGADKNLYALNKEVVGEEAFGHDTKGQTKIIYVSPENLEVKIKSLTCNPTYIFNVKLK